MQRSDVLRLIQKNVDQLSRFDDPEYQYIPLHQKASPSVEALNRMMMILRNIIFPGFFGEKQEAQQDSMPYYLGVNLEHFYDILSDQIASGICFDTQIECSKERSSNIAATFIDYIPRIKHLLSTDVKAILDGDPAAKSQSEVIFCYPSILALLHQRAAHELLLLGVPVIPRIISEMAHAITGIDIHPGAQIGEYFGIDHGTGVVVGETTIIGNHVKLYQGVTLGAKSFKLDEKGLPLNIPRHPIIEDNVTIYSNSSILGRITIGHDSIIGGNIWLTHDVPPCSKVLQSTAVEDK